MSRLLFMEIPLAWQFIRKNHQLIEEVLSAYPENLRYAASMVAAELVGNAIKYGSKDPRATQPTIAMDVIDNRIVIEVSNGLSSDAQFREVNTYIEQLSQSTNKEASYHERLHELLVGSGQGRQIGLYRIAYEGEFNLACTYAGRVLTVIATRKLS